MVQSENHHTSTTIIDDNATHRNVKLDNVIYSGTVELGPTNDTFVQHPDEGDNFHIALPYHLS